MRVIRTTVIPHERAWYSRRTAARCQAGAPAKSVVACAGAVLGTAAALAQPDYAPAHWNQANCVKYYTSGYTRSFCVIHDMEGYYLDSISYLNRCDTNSSGVYNVDASVYYLVNGLQNGSDTSGHAENHPDDPVAGDITQSVRESRWAWHARCWNKYMFGTEHEGFVSNPAWYTEAMYQASAGLQRYLCNKYGIAKDRNHIIGHNEWQNAAWRTWMTNNFPAIDPTCNSHTDPGQYWNWTHFIGLINGTSNPGGPYWDMNGPTLGAGTAPTGTWDNSATNWTADPNGGIGTGPWGGTNAIFAAGSDSVGTYSVTVVNTQTVNNLLVQRGNLSFNGGQLNFKGSGLYYSNYVAAGSTVTFNTVFGGTGAPDKWGPGTAIYNGANTCAGYFTLNEGTLLLGNNAALSTVRLEVGDQAGANTVTLGCLFGAGFTLSNYLTLKSPTINISPGGNLTFSGPINVNSNALVARTLVLSNGLTFSGVLTNTGGLTKAGFGTLTLSGTSANTYGSASANGNTTVSGGTLLLSKTAGVTAVPNGSLILNTGGTLALGAADQIGNAVPMTLSGGTFATAGHNEQLGTLKLTVNSRIDLGTGASVLRFAASSGVAWTGGTTLTISNWNGSLSGGGADQVIFGSNISGLSASQVAQVRFANPPGFPAGNYAAVILSTGEVVPVNLTPTLAAPTRLANGSFQFQVAGVAGSNYSIWGSTNLHDWTPLRTNPSPFTFTDTNTSSYPSRFYRARFLP